MIIQGDAGWLPLRDASVDLVVTSPPYFEQRIYQDGDVPVRGQIGGEAHPQQWLEALWAVMTEVWRVLKPAGSCFVNLGDKRASRHGLFGRPKAKMLLPHRFAIGCEDGLADPEGEGWVVRQDCVWLKTNGMPEPATDRCRDSHEYLFHLTRQGQYYADLAEIREPSTAVVTGRNMGTWRKGPGNNRGRAVGRTHLDGGAIRDLAVSTAGRSPASVWQMASDSRTAGQKQAIPDGLPPHSAPFPTEMVRRVVLGWSPMGGVVLDPFGGSGTAAGVAGALGRLGVSADLSNGYCRLASHFVADGSRFEKVRARANADLQAVML